MLTESPIGLDPHRDIIQVLGTPIEHDDFERGVIRYVVPYRHLISCFLGDVIRCNLPIVLQYLIDHGEDVFRGDHFYFEYALSPRREQVLQVFVNNGLNPTQALKDLIYFIDLESVNYLVAIGAKIDRYYLAKTSNIPSKTLSYLKEIFG